MCGGSVTFRMIIHFSSGYARGCHELTGGAPEKFGRVAGRPETFRTSDGRAVEKLLDEKSPVITFFRAAPRSRDRGCRLHRDPPGGFDSRLRNLPDWSSPGSPNLFSDRCGRLL